MSRYRAYPEYKDSGVEWLGEVPSYWEIKKLKYICKVKTGDKDTVDAVDDGIYPFFVRSQTVERINSIGADCEAVLTAGDGVGVGKVFHYFHGKFDYHQRVYMLNSFSKVFGRFVFYYLSNNFYKVALEGNAKSTVDSLRLPQFLNFEFSLPEIDVQRRIVQFLNHETAKIDTLIEKQKQLIKLLKEKRQAVISSAVTRGINSSVLIVDSGIEKIGFIPEHWEIVMLGKKIQLQRGVDITKDEQIEGDIPVVSSGGIQSFHNQFTTKGPGVVVGRKGTAGKLHYIDTNFWAHDTTLYVKEFRGNEVRYVYYKLLSMNLEDYDTGSANPTLNRNLVHPEIVSWAPIEEQKEIVGYLDRFCSLADKTTVKINDAILLLKERRTALISAAVTGKIDVRNWQEPSQNQKETNKEEVV